MIGIENVNEYYTNHYLDAILESDIRPQLQEWRDADEDGEMPTPWRRLSQLQQDFFRHRERMERVRSNAERIAAHQQMSVRLLDALGYETKPVLRELEAGPLAILGEYTRGDGEPLLWLLPAAAGQDEEEGVLSRPLLTGQHEVVHELPVAFNPDDVFERTVEELVTDAFQLPDPPRFVLILGDAEWVLADRGKWPEQRLLRFDLDELLGRRDTDALQAMAALLHRETLAPESGTSLVDTLDDSSHKHAYEVSEDLKYALQASIEAIGNEAIRYRRDVSKAKVYGEEIDGQQLAIECIRYMYRILFLLYIEARPELGYAPMGSDAYRLGYSFERLREMETLELETPEARNGYTIDLSLKRLFEMVYHGVAPEGERTFLGPDAQVRADIASEDVAEASVHDTFRLVPLQSHLFDPERTPFLNKVKLRNAVLLEVIKAMSLSKPQGKGKKKRRGRISYATLGINQLGAVYEALLSFRGFFAEETLYEVKSKKTDQPDPVRDPAYFVPEADLHQYETTERVFDEDGQVKAYPPGTFIYRMAGRDRQKSASYYTPEVLTKCLVKYALKELLEDEDGNPKHERAEDLLELTICEPAMGSAAFLNEAINQIAERYLARRQQELGERIPHDRYAHELQRVRMYIADNNVYGVDLNPIALELAEVSLWLNAIFTDEAALGKQVFVPWFGGQLCTGNSLVGAWRKVFSADEVASGPRGKSSGWLDAVPERIPLGTERPEGSIYHFLLPDRGMAVYGQGNEGKPIREMCGEELAKIEAWRKEMCRPLSDNDRAALVRLSDAVDRLWAKHTELLARIRERTTDPLSVYGHEHPLKGQAPTSTRDKDKIWRHEMESEQVRASSPYRRLKMAMDYWCALWFWPIQQADMLPSRSEWLADMALLLDSEVLPDLDGGMVQRDMFAPTMPAAEAQSLVDEVGFADVEGLIARWPRLGVADELAARYRFHHWGLEFADIIAKRGGFDLVLGNPPWVLVRWEEAGILGDLDPSIALRRTSALDVARVRADLMEDLNTRQDYLDDHEGTYSLQSFLSNPQNYPALRGGVRVNLYKCFVPLSWTLQRRTGIAALIHPEGLFTDPKGPALRQLAYGRLRRHYQFQNVLKLFPILHWVKYSINIYGPSRPAPKFISISNVFHPLTIDSSHSHNGAGPVPGIKDASFDWEIAGHADRIIEVSDSEVAANALLFDKPGSSSQSGTLPAFHSKAIADVIQRFATARKLSDLERVQPSPHWHEAHAQRDGTISKHTSFVKEIEEFVYSGPHFYVGNPLYKTPRRVCNNPLSFDVIDLTCIGEDYVPRTNFVRACSRSSYRARASRLKWVEDSGRRVVDHYRLLTSARVSPPSERTFRVAIIPPGAAHLDSSYSYTFDNVRDLVHVAAVWSSLPVDFFIKTTGMGNVRPSIASRLPIGVECLREMSLRILLLNCLNSSYAPIWTKSFDPAYCGDQWAKSNIRLAPEHFAALGRDWQHFTPLRSDYARRQALVEIDVLVAQQLLMTLAELIGIYQIQFPVLCENESDTWYDCNGRIVFTCSKGLSGVGLPRSNKKSDPSPCWNDVKHMAEELGYSGSDTVTQTVIDDTLPGGPREKTIVYQAPWVRCDRERDYEVAWAHFAERFGTNGRS